MMKVNDADISSLSGHIFFCIDAHTCGNPVRLVAEGAPPLQGGNMREKRLHFMREYDWIRKALMFEPRGHDMMSGSILYAPHDQKNDAAVLFIETSGCLPMCGHGTIGTVTIAIEEGLIIPGTSGLVRLETPAGLVTATYVRQGKKVKSVKITNVTSFMVREDIQVECPGLGLLKMDVAYGGNFYAIIDPQENFPGLENYRGEQLIAWSRILRERINEVYGFVHPEDEAITGLSHVMWTGAPLDKTSSGRSAVFYGDKAIDRSPCGTGTSARMAQLFARGKLKMGDTFVHESIIGTRFTGRIEAVVPDVFGSGTPGIIPSIEGWARIYGHNTISVDVSDDPFAHGFQVI
ncbi:MAG TPA: 4-hydroxyproline epimerase [Chitinophagaceae bacterium]|nr:4-hydroxyproline epimerase [Chitinophagaceae bacterium]